MPPPIIVPEETECLGLHGEGYQEYAWQKGTSHVGGLSASDWTRIARNIFPYKNWDGVPDSDTDPSSDTSDAEAIPEKTVRAAGIMNEAMHAALEGVKVEINTVVARRFWTDYEKKRLQQSMELAARWSTQPNTGSVYARDCRGVTTNVIGTCGSCAVLAQVPALQRAVRKARANAALSDADFAAKLQKKVRHTPLILRDSAAVDIKISLANPAVIKILSSKALHGPGC
jgi:hypothetical protein